MCSLIGCLFLNHVIIGRGWPEEEQDNCTSLPFEM